MQGFKNKTKLSNKISYNVTGINDVKITTMKEKMIGEKEIISIKEMRSMKMPYKYISDRFGISIERVKAICKVRKK